MHLRNIGLLPVCSHRYYTDNIFPVVIEAAVRFVPNSDYRTAVQIEVPKNPRPTSSRRFQALRGSRSNYVDSPRPFDPRDLILGATGKRC